jgi:hypothetical protein
MTKHKFIRLSDTKCAYTPSRDVPCEYYVRDHSTVFRVGAFLTKVDAEFAAHLNALWNRS